MEVARHEAEAMLTDAERAEQAVARRSPKEYVPFFGWGLFQALVIPGFDVFNPDVWGWVTIAIAAMGFAATCAYFAIRNLRVRVADRSPWWTWPVLSLWMGLVAVLAIVLDDYIPFPFTLSGIVSSLPLFAWGIRLWRTQ